MQYGTSTHKRTEHNVEHYINKHLIRHRLELRIYLATNQRRNSSFPDAISCPEAGFLRQDRFRIQHRLKHLVHRQSPILLLEQWCCHKSWHDGPQPNLERKSNFDNGGIVRCVRCAQLLSSSQRHSRAERKCVPVLKKRWVGQEYKGLTYHMSPWDSFENLSSIAFCSFW